MEAFNFIEYENFVGVLTVLSSFSIIVALIQKNIKTIKSIIFMAV
jgi:hypothetical protein